MVILRCNSPRERYDTLQMLVRGNWRILVRRDRFNIITVAHNNLLQGAAYGYGLKGKVCNMIQKSRYLEAFKLLYSNSNAAQRDLHAFIKNQVMKFHN